MPDRLATHADRVSWIRFWMLVSRLGRLPRFWLAYAVALAATGRRGRLAARDAALAATLTDRLVSLVLKPLFRRPRPARPRQRYGVPTDHSFPSAHAANSFAFATAVGHAIPALRKGSYLVAATVAVSRGALGVHYASDIVAGASVGYAVARAVRRIASHPAKGARMAESG